MSATPAAVNAPARTPAAAVRLRRTSGGSRRLDAVESRPPACRPPIRPRVPASSPARRCRAHRPLRDCCVHRAVAGVAHGSGIVRYPGHHGGRCRGPSRSPTPTCGRWRRRRAVRVRRGHVAFARTAARAGRGADESGPLVGEDQGRPRPGADPARLATVREVIGGDVELMVEANGASPCAGRSRPPPSSTPRLPSPSSKSLSPRMIRVVYGACATSRRRAWRPSQAITGPTSSTSPARSTVSTSCRSAPPAATAPSASCTPTGWLSSGARHLGPFSAGPQRPRFSRAGRGKRNVSSSGTRFRYVCVPSSDRTPSGSARGRGRAGGQGGAHRRAEQPAPVLGRP